MCACMREWPEPQTCRAEDGVNALANRREVNVQRSAGHSILFQTHLGHKEAVDDVERAKLKIDLPVDGQYKFARDDVVFAVSI